MFSKKKKKINKTLARLTKEKVKRTQINKIRNEKGDIITNNTQNQKIVRGYYEKNIPQQTGQCRKIKKFLETYNLVILNQEKNRKFV